MNFTCTFENDENYFEPRLLNCIHRSSDCSKILWTLDILNQKNNSNIRNSWSNLNQIEYRYVNNEYNESQLLPYDDWKPIFENVFVMECAVPIIPTPIAKYRLSVRGQSLRDSFSRPSSRF